MLVGFAPGVKATTEEIESIPGISMTYLGSKTIYKKNTSILLLSDIYNLTFRNWIITDESDEYDVHSYYVTTVDDLYTGNGNVVGWYTITSKLVATLKDSNGKLLTISTSELVNICVDSKLGCNYIYENKYYYDLNYIPNGEDLFFILSYNQQLPADNSLYITYESDYFNEYNEISEDVSTGEYLVKFKYISTSGYSGTGTCYINISDPLVINNTTSSDTWYLVFGVLVLALIIFFITYLFKNKNKQKGWKIK